MLSFLREIIVLGLNAHFQITKPQEKNLKVNGGHSILCLAEAKPFRWN